MIRFTVDDYDGTLTVYKFEEAYDAYCRIVHCAVLNPTVHKKGKMCCYNPDGNHTLFCFADGEFMEFVPCMGCKYLDECTEKGNPYKDLEGEE